MSKKKSFYKLLVIDFCKKVASFDAMFYISNLTTRVNHFAKATTQCNKYRLNYLPKFPDSWEIPIM